MAVTVNANLMAEGRKYAEGFPNVGGVMHPVNVILLPHVRIYRFATAGTPENRLYAASWWFGFSAHEALSQIANREARSLREVARECLAVPPEWENAMNLLVSAHVRRALSAWSGTPRTARSKDTSTHRYGKAWEPDRSITQLYIPGLSQRRPDGRLGPFVPWSEVLAPGAPERIG